MQVLSEEYQKELAQGVISVLDKALEDILSSINTS